MREQGWATEHYEQLYRATGTVQLPTGEVGLAGTGWRDHSRGPRAGTGTAWGGHVILGCLLTESGRAFGLSRYWSPDGTVTLEGGYVVIDGVLRHGEVVTVPALRSLQHSGEELRIALKWSEGAMEVSATTVTAMWATLAPGLPYGVGPDWAALVYALNFARCEWDGEQAHLYIERSDTVAAP